MDVLKCFGEESIFIRLQNIVLLNDTIMCDSSCHSHKSLNKLNLLVLEKQCFACDFGEWFC